MVDAEAGVQQRLAQPGAAGGVDGVLGHDVVVVVEGRGHRDLHRAGMMRPRFLRTASSSATTAVSPATKAAR